MGQGLGGGGLRFLVVVLAVDDRGKALPRVGVDVLPDVQHAAAGGVHEHAALGAQELHLHHRHPEGGQDHHVLRRHLGVAPVMVGGLGQDADPQALDAAVHVGVVDDLAGEEDPAVGELLAGLVGVLHRPVDPVAEAELAGQAQPDVPCPRGVVEPLQALHHLAVVVLREDRPHHGLEVEALLEVRLAHRNSITRTPAGA